MKLFAITHDTAGNLPPLPAIFPDKVGPYHPQLGKQKRR